MFYYPVKGKFIITCPFGKSGSWSCGWHIGIDIVTSEDYNIYSSYKGIVTGINSKGKAYGNHVLITHPNGFVTLYAHLDSICVKENQFINTGEKIGVMGSTGNATGRHLHFEMHNGRYKYPSKGSTPSDCKWLLNPVDYLELEDLINRLKILVDETPIYVDAINIDGSNYIKLRDLEKIFDVSVGFDGKNPTISKK